MSSEATGGSTAQVITKLCQERHVVGLLQGHSTKAQDPGAWATGIVEVALPVEYKMQNIEETEAAKRRLLHASRSPLGVFKCSPIAVEVT